MGNLTAVKVKSLKVPGKYTDGDGLILIVGPNGSKSWLLRTQSKGRRRDIGLGSVDLVTLGEAREVALKMRRQIKQGLDPVAEREKERKPALTFREAAVRVHKLHEKGWKNGKHQAQWLSTLERYAFPTLGNRAVGDIGGPAIRDVLEPIWLTKPETARRVRQRIGAVLDWACASGLRETEAPMRALSKGLPRQPKKDRHFAALPFELLPDFMSQLRQRTTMSRLALEFLILTAARSGEVRLAPRAEIDADAKLWSIPGERMKMGRAHHVPLATASLDVVLRAKALRPYPYELLFPGQSPRRPLSDMTLLKIVRDMDFDVTVHGFRSTFRDWVAEMTNYPGEVAETALAHSIPNKVEAAYRRTDYLEKRRLLMNDWAAFCMSKCNE